MVREGERLIVLHIRVGRDVGYVAWGEGDWV